MRGLELCDGHSPRGSGSGRVMETQSRRCDPRRTPKNHEEASSWGALLPTALPVPWDVKQVLPAASVSTVQQLWHPQGVTDEQRKLLHKSHWPERGHLSRAEQINTNLTVQPVSGGPGLSVPLTNFWVSLTPSFTIFKKLCVCVCACTHALYVHVWVGIFSSQKIPQDWSYKWFWVALHGSWERNPGPLSELPSVLNQWAISPVSKF